LQVSKEKKEINSKRTEQMSFAHVRVYMHSVKKEKKNIVVQYGT